MQESGLKITYSIKHSSLFFPCNKFSVHKNQLCECFQGWRDKPLFSTNKELRPVKKDSGACFPFSKPQKNCVTRKIENFKQLFYLVELLKALSNRYKVWRPRHVSYVHCPRTTPLCPLRAHSPIPKYLDSLLPSLNTPLIPLYMSWASLTCPEALSHVPSLSHMFGAELSHLSWASLTCFESL